MEMEGSLLGVMNVPLTDGFISPKAQRTSLFSMPAVSALKITIIAVRISSVTVSYCNHVCVHVSSAPCFVYGVPVKGTVKIFSILKMKKKKKKENIWNLQVLYYTGTGGSSPGQDGGKDKPKS